MGSGGQAVRREAEARHLPGAVCVDGGGAGLAPGGRGGCLLLSRNQKTRR